MQPKTHIDPETGRKQWLAPTGRYLHMPPEGPDSAWSSSEFIVPWWQDERYCIGKLSKCTRNIRIVNTLTKHDNIVEVASEETINEILDRYLVINAHAASYTWKRLGKVLDMAKNLDQNGIVDDTEEMKQLGLPTEEYVPALHLYFNDDLTVV